MKKLLLMLLTLTTVLGLLLGTVGCTFLPNDPTEPTEEVTEPTVDNTLADAKTEAKTALDSYATPADYREAQQAELTAAIEAGKAAIDAAVDVAAVDSALSAAKTVIDGIKTDAELTAEEEAATLAAAKTDAKATLDAFANPADYREAQQAELATAIANGKTAIDSATDVDAVNAALADAKATIDALETDAELTVKEEAAALTAAKTDAKAALDTYVNADDYRAAEKLVLAAAIAEGKTAIDNATDIQTVNATLIGVKAAIDEIKTDAQLTAEEAAAAAALATAKLSAKTELEGYVKAEDYREAQQAELATAIANGKTAIDGAADVASVEAALAAAKAAIDAIDTDAEITAKSPTITTTITDGMTFTSNKATLDVWVKDASGNKLAASKVTVTVNGEVASINWDDTEKTSYNFVFEDGENTVIITATDGGYCTTVTYTVLCDASAPTTITVAVEGFTVGLDYIVAPYKLILDEDTLTDMAGLYGYADAAEMKENLTAAHALDYTLQLHGLTMGYQGGLESGSGFYMSSVSGLDTSNATVPDELLAKLEENGYYPDSAPYTEGTLGEFDFTWGAGWMYFVNNAAPNVGFCDYVPQGGDVMRIQFTLAYGADIGSTMMGDLWFESVDRDELTQLIADAIEAGVDYSEALEVVSTFGVTQDELDAACEALRAQLG